jgi:hypothetical protein
MTGTPAARAEDGPPEGVEVLTRGPVHEAFAEPATVEVAPTPLIDRRPPDPIEEMPADQKPEGDHVQWIPGYWAYDEDRADFLWVSGIWRVPPPDREWMPGRWTGQGDGWRWVPGMWAPTRQEEITYLPPPPAPVETAVGPAPDSNSVYVPGTWVYRTSRYVWRPGFWAGYRPGWVWTPARYLWTPAGYVFVDGYWDYALRDRGLLFAPVGIDLRVVRLARWYYQPSYVVYGDGLLGALFVRANYGSYYFGDYFDARYRRLGFTAWVDVRFGRGYDPLFSYYRWTYRDDRRWERGLRDLYVGRFEGKVPRPPRTLVQQNTLVRSVGVQNVNRVNVKQATLVTPLAKVDPTVVRLQPVSAQRLTAERKAVQQLRTVSGERARLEVPNSPRGPVGPATAPRTVRVETPRTTGRPSTPIGRTPPPLPLRPEVRPTPAKPTGSSQPALPRSDVKPAQPGKVVPTPTPAKPPDKTPAFREPKQAPAPAKTPTKVEPAPARQQTRAVKPEIGLHHGPARDIKS